ncbi:MAG: hypothetical protein AAGU12_11595 [Clostridiales bacterium]
MKLELLLEELIDIAQKPKTDFALSLNMTPSGLSKILTGKRVPVLKERKAFTKQTADYFAEAIYSPKCYLKFEKIFPIIYDFESQNDLQQFLVCAIEYALDDAYVEGNHLRIEYADRAMYYLGRKPVLNQLCVLLSDYTLKGNGALSEWFGCLPFRDPSYAKIFQKVILQGRKLMSDAVFNFYFDETLFDSGIGGTHFLTLIATLQEHIALNFWQTPKDIGQSFILLKGQMLLLFSTQIDGTPILTPIFNKTYLAIFYNLLVKKEAKKISYSKKEILEVLENNPDGISAFINREIDSVYNFISIGYLLQKNELAAAQCNDMMADLVWGLLQNILVSNNTIFHVSYAAMERFVTLGKAIVPLVGAIPFAPKERVPYLSRFGAYLQAGASHDKVKIINSELNNIALFCCTNLNIVYTVDDSFQKEWFHFFNTDKIGAALREEKKLETMDFSADIWEAYQNTLNSKFA